MNCKGKLERVLLNCGTQQHLIQLEVDADEKDLEGLIGKDLSIGLEPDKNLRSREANSCYWALCTKIANATGHSKSYTHNDLLRKYGQPELRNGNLEYLMLPDTKEEEIKADESKTFHAKRTSHVLKGDDGIMYRMYVLLKGSSEYTAEEMSQLIEGAVAEAKNLGIETAAKKIKEE